MLRQIGPTEIVLILLLLMVQVVVVAGVVYLIVHVLRGRGATKDGSSDDGI